MIILGKFKLDQSAKSWYMHFKHFHIGAQQLQIVDYCQLTFINLVLFVDLYFAMVNPFYPRNSRLKFYLLGSITLTLAALIVSYSYKYTNEPKENQLLLYHR